MKKIEIWKKELRRLPEGSLYCVRRSEKAYYYQAINGRRFGITENMDLVYDLARKRYLTELLKDCGSADKLIEYYGQMHLNIQRITCSKEHYSWMRSSYVQNPTYPERKIYETYSGIKVRSKSEQRIGNELELKGIPYRYEQGIAIPVDWMEGVIPSEDGVNKLYYPDFIILTTTGRQIIWEHLGRVDQKKYRDHNMEKISAYRQGAGFSDSQLILTFEHDVNTMAGLEEIIRQRILFQF